MSVYKSTKIQMCKNAKIQSYNVLHFQFWPLCSFRIHTRTFSPSRIPRTLQPDKDAGCSTPWSSQSQNLEREKKEKKPCSSQSRLAPEQPTLQTGSQPRPPFSHFFFKDSEKKGEGTSSCFFFFNFANFLSSILRWSSAFRAFLSSVIILSSSTFSRSRWAFLHKCKYTYKYTFFPLLLPFNWVLISVTNTTIIFKYWYRKGERKKMWTNTNKKYLKKYNLSLPELAFLPLLLRLQPSFDPIRALATFRNHLFPFF